MLVVPGDGTERQVECLRRPFLIVIVASVRRLDASRGGDGGAVTTSSISATPTAYAGGGGGSSYFGPNPGPGGAGTPTSGTGGPGCGSGGNGGAGVIHIMPGDENLMALLEIYSQNAREPVIVQKYLPEVRIGDKRIILIDGQVAGATNRIPKKNHVQDYT